MIAKNMITQTMSLFKQSKQAETVIARYGISAWLLFLCAMLMSFLSVYTLTLGGTASKLAQNWEATINDSATLRIVASSDTPENINEIVTAILDTTPGIAEFQELASERQLALLSPWLGDEIPADLLSLPQIYAVTVDVKSLDEEGLMSRLKAELPSAIWDNHQRWRGPLLSTAKRLKLLSMASTIIIGFAFIFLIFVSAEASMFSNSASISLLRQIGAEDRWIANGFVRKFVGRTTAGAAVGVILGCMSTFGLQPNDTQGGGIYVIGNFYLSQFLRAALVIIAAALIGFASTRFATYRYLKKVS